MIPQMGRSGPRIFVTVTILSILIIGCSRSSLPDKSGSGIDKEKADTIYHEYPGDEIGLAIPEDAERGYQGMFGQLIERPIWHSVISGKPKDGYWGMEGTLKIHPFTDIVDSLSGKEIYELQDNKNVPVWFCRHIYKDVCSTGSCKMVRLWLFWDGAGNYLGIQLDKREPLTKSEHTEFTREDYEKLDEILKDTSSILKNFTYEELERELSGENEKEESLLQEVDAISGATPPSLVSAVVKDAVYTCHSLWHTVYGPTRKSIMELLDQRVDRTFLRRFMESEKSSYISWAIQKIESHPEYHDTFYTRIVSLIVGEDEALSEQALNYLRPERMKDFKRQKSIIMLLSEISPEKQNRILWKLSGVDKVSADMMVMVLESFEAGKIGMGTLTLIYRSVRPEHFSDKRLLTILNSFLAHDNAYIRTLTERLFREKGREFTRNEKVVHPE